MKPSTQSAGVGIRVLAFGCWGFAATDDLSNPGVERAAALALEIARAGTAARKRDVALAPEERYEATWVSPIGIDPTPGRSMDVFRDTQWNR